MSISLSLEFVGSILVFCLFSVVVLTEHLVKGGETCCMSNNMKQKRIQTTN